MDGVFCGQGKIKFIRLKISGKVGKMDAIGIVFERPFADGGTTRPVSITRNA
jgi:hypothetical protein